MIWAIFGGAFCKARYEIRRRREARAGKNSWWTLTLQPPSFLPARAEKFLSKFAVWIFVKKSSSFAKTTADKSDFVQKVP